MSDKFWVRSDEWYGYAPCFGYRDFTIPPSRDDGGPVADADLVRTICAGCRVRPECARTAANEQWNGVWVCGTWIPAHDDDRREAGAVRDRLAQTVADEESRRGHDV